MKFGVEKPKESIWTKVSHETWINQTGHIWVDISSFCPPSMIRVIEMIYDEKEKSFVLDTLWALKDKKESKDIFIKGYLERYSKE